LYLPFELEATEKRFSLGGVQMQPTHWMRCKWYASHRVFLSTLTLLEQWIKANPKHPLRRSAIYLLRDLSLQTDRAPSQLAWTIPSGTVIAKRHVKTTGTATIYTSYLDGEDVALKEFTINDNDDAKRKVRPSFLLILSVIKSARSYFIENS
jgi:hypothetical protein